MAKKHARLSPSSADRWTSCTASPAAQDGIPNENSDASRAGTTCHQIQEEVLLNPERDLQIYLGAKLVFWSHPEGESKGETWNEEFHAGMAAEVHVEAEVEVTQDMIDAVESAVTFIRQQHELLGGRMFVEQRVPVGQFTGEEDESESGLAEGSADVILQGDDWIHVMDSKFGRKRVNASRLISPAHVDFITGTAQPEKRGANLQMACYALGSVHKHDVFGEVKKVTMTIVQPFIDHTDSYSCSIEELRETENFLRNKANETRTSPVFAPNFSNCFFCRAKDTCDARSGLAMSTVFHEFEDGTGGVVRAPDPLLLGSQYALIPFVRQWADDIEALTRTKLEDGEVVRRNDGLTYKLVDGKAAAREWIDPAEAEAYLNRIRVKREDMYSYKVVTPTQAEKLSKSPKVPKGQEPPPPVLGPRQWETLKALIAPQGKTKPTIVLETDPKPAIDKAAGFDDVPTQDPSLAELFGE